MSGAGLDMVIDSITWSEVEEEVEGVVSIPLLALLLPLCAPDLM